MRLYEITRGDTVHYKLQNNTTLSSDYKSLISDYALFKNRINSLIPKSKRDKNVLSDNIANLINRINKIHHMCVDIVTDDPSDKDAHNIISILYDMIVHLEDLKSKIS